ncbi:hypothetical protein [Micromonospora sp. NPDC048898]
MLGLSVATLVGYLAAIVVLMVTPGPDMSRSRVAAPRGPSCVD